MEMTYNTDTLANLYHKWTGGKAYLPEAIIGYMGDLSGVSVVDFGCGQAAFLKLCLENGSSHCLGLDLNEAMIKKAMEDPEIRNYVSDGKLQLAIQDCMIPMTDQYGKFDIALSQYVLFHCSDDEKLLIYYKNIFQSLKPGGRVIISACPPVATIQERDTAVELIRLIEPLKSDFEGKDQFLAKVPCLYSLEEVKEGKAGPWDVMFYFNLHYWSKEKLMEKLKQAGFQNVHLLEDTPNLGMDVKEALDLSNQGFLDQYIHIVGHKHK